MKRFLTFLFISLFTVSAFAEPLTGIFDINFGDNQKTVIEKMNKRGWKTDDTDIKSTLYHFSKNNGTYGNLSVDYIYVFFDDNNKLNEIHINFAKTLDKYDFIGIVNTFIAKYKIENKEIYNSDNASLMLDGRSENNIEVYANGLYDAKIFTIQLTDCNSDL